jgi:AraC-like DNA-binding protein
LFSEVENKTIEQYYIQLKVERVKELLTYNELNLNEIAYQLNYSSFAYLSNQFKKVTGITPSDLQRYGTRFWTNFELLMLMQVPHLLLSA